MFHHDIHFAHTRHPATPLFDHPESASSAISISVDSNDLVEAFSELVSRLPEDVKMALKLAMDMVDK